MSRPHKPDLDEMGIGTWHEVKPARSSSPAEAPSAKAGATSPLEGEVGAQRREGGAPGPRSKLGRPGQRGGFKSNRRR